MLLQIHDFAEDNRPGNYLAIVKASGAASSADVIKERQKLARLLGVKTTQPATRDQGRRWTGYEFGGTSPLGMRTQLPVFAEKTIADLETVYVNAGSKGFIVAMRGAVLIDAARATLGDLAA